jgi:hypothetical protein
MWYSGGRKRSEKMSHTLSGGRGHQMQLTRAITHIRLCDANHAKVAALDGVAAEYKALFDTPHGIKPGRFSGYARPTGPR